MVTFAVGTVAGALPEPKAPGAIQAQNEKRTGVIQTRRSGGGPCFFRFPDVISPAMGSDDPQGEHGVEIFYAPTGPGNLEAFRQDVAVRGFAPA